MWNWQFEQWKLNIYIRFQVSMWQTFIVCFCKGSVCLWEGENTKCKPPGLWAEEDCLRLPPLAGLCGPCSGFLCETERAVSPPPWAGPEPRSPGQNPGLLTCAAPGSTWTRWDRQLSNRSIIKVRKSLRPDWWSSCRFLPPPDLLPLSGPSSSSALKMVQWRRTPSGDPETWDQTSVKGT